MARAIATDCRRTAARPPLSTTRRWRVRRPARAQARWTRPTGLAADPPPGPAMPVTDTAISTRALFRAPSDIRIATILLTAPWVAMSFAGTPRSSVLAAFEYVT